MTASFHPKKAYLLDLNVSDSKVCLLFSKFVGRDALGIFFISTIGPAYWVLANGVFS
jgi:hypothetical protein